MKKWMIVSAFVACLGAGTPVFAADYTDVVIAQLQQQGYGRIETEVTWLGRVRIVARSDSGAREIILNPRTGEILRDLWLLANGEAGNSLLIGSGVKAGVDDEDDDTDDSGGDDSGDDDNSGSGSSGSDDDDDSGGDDDGGSDNSGSGSDGGDDD